MLIEDCTIKNKDFVSRRSGYARLFEKLLVTRDSDYFSFLRFDITGSAER